MIRVVIVTILDKRKRVNESWVEHYARRVPAYAPTFLRDDMAESMFFDNRQAATDDPPLLSLRKKKKKKRRIDVQERAANGEFGSGDDDAPLPKLTGKDKAKIVRESAYHVLTMSLAHLGLTPEHIASIAHEIGNNASQILVMSEPEED